MKRRAAIALAVAALAIPWRAEARSQVELPWPMAQVYPLAVRYVRVDRGCKIVDKDPDSAFLVFECPDDGGKLSRHGALELIAGEVQQRPGVRLQVTLTDEPKFMEQRFLELLERKLKDERGPVPPPAPKPPAPPPPPPPPATPAPTG